MRRLSLAVLFALPVALQAQTATIERQVRAKLLEERQRQQTLKYVASLYDAETGAYKADTSSKPSLRACNGAAKVTRYLGGMVADKEKTAAFVRKCYDPKTGAFAEPGGKPDAIITSIGVITAVEFGVPKEKFPKALEYIKENAKTFEDVRMGAAAVEALNVKPKWREEWIKFAIDHADKTREQVNGPENRLLFGSLGALLMRLGVTLNESAINVRNIAGDQSEDGAYGKTKNSDLSSTYKVMRFLSMTKVKPTEPAKLKSFIAKCRNADGGYGVEPGKLSSVGGTYYAVTVLHWLAELEK
ncbi:MAG TPA: prenyltransferase/squalene oxidase repeat-containing protein [Fimbriiglobus sp.]|jgi:hypothetical protein